MASIGNSVLDGGLNVLDTEGDRLDICSQEPTTHTEATSTYTLGNKTALSIGAPADRGGGGREVTVAEITDGAVTGTDTATHWAISDHGSTDLLATGAISVPQGVTDGNTFELAAFTIGIPDPA